MYIKTSAQTSMATLVLFNEQGKDKGRYAMNLQNIHLLFGSIQQP